MKPSILIALPFYRSVNDANTTLSLMSLVAALSAKGIQYRAVTMDYGDIAEARNALASLFLRHTKLDRLLMIDSDMVFQPSAVLRMIDANVDVIGCAAPMRSGGSNATGLKPSTNGVAVCERVGTGLMLISRNALQKLSESKDVRGHPVHSFNSVGLTAPVHGFFDRVITPTVRLSEDYAFCERWRVICKGTVYAITDEKIGHVKHQVLSS